MERRFFLVNRDLGVRTRYRASFLPRVGDTIAVASLRLKVVDVVLDSVKAGDEGMEHTAQVHVSGAKSNADERFVDVNFDDFCTRSK
jgi:hypothetical protein